MLYAAKCYWPGVTETDLQQVAERAARGDTRSRDEGVAYLGSLLFSAEDLVLCLFEGPSRTAVKHASERAGIPCERLMDSVWLQPDQRARTRGVTMTLSAVGPALRRAKRWVSRALQLARGAVTVASALLVVGSLATAARAADGGWSVVSSPNPVASNGQLSSVSCSAASACMAVGSFVRDSSAGVTLAERWDGHAWSIESAPRPQGTLTVLYGVSCVSSKACMAVGRYLNDSGTFVTLAERWNGTNWIIVRTPSPAGAAGSLLDGVACTSDSACIAVGAVTSGSGFGLSGTLAERWDGIRWSIVPVPHSSSAGGVLNSVACSSASACTAVGVYADSFGANLPLAERWNGTTWSVQPTPNPEHTQSGAGLNGVACASSSACTAVGNYFTTSGVGVTLAEQWDGTRWRIVPTPSPAGLPFSVLGAVACTSASACTAVGLTVSGFASSGVPRTQMLAERWNGTRWSIQPTPNPSGALPSALFGVACPSSSVCTAVGDSGLQTLAERSSGTEWSVQSTPTPSGAQSSALNAVACTSSSSCNAVGNEADVFRNPTGTLAERWNGAEWKIEPTPNPAGAVGSLLTGVACTSGSACIAVGASTDSSGIPTGTLAERWNGARWRILPTPNRAAAPGSFLTAVSCSSASACIAVGSLNTSSGSPNGTFAEGWNGNQWTILPTPNPAGAPQSSLNGVSCTSSSACIAVGSAADSSGNPLGTLAERWNGTGWSILATPNPDDVQNSFLNSVACPSASVCTAAGLTFPATGPRTLAEQWNGTTWKIQPTPPIPFAYDMDPPSIACPSLSTCTAVGGYTNDGPKVTLAENWSSTEPSSPPSSGNTQTAGGPSSVCFRPSRRRPFLGATFDPTSASQSIFARVPQCPPM